MGNCHCTCFKGKKEEALIEIAHDQIGQDRTVPMQTPQKYMESTSLLMGDFKVESLSVHLVQTQSIIRGYLTRKVLESEMGTEFPLDLVELEELPSDLLSGQAAAKYKELGAYKFEDHHMPLVVSRGPIRLPDGRIYVGDWNSNHEPHGNGTIYFEDKSLCEGCFRNGMLNGMGRRISSDGDVYLGSWKHNEKSGKGKIVFRFSGNSYNGDWQNDFQHGYGEENWPDGSSFKGNYIMGSKEGKGRFEWADGSTYEGQFTNNQIEGYGTYVWNNGREYTGEWLENKMHGKGLFKWSDGRSYEGEYVMDQKEGWGVFLWPDGKKYEGDWRDGKQHGQGTLTNSKGKSRTGLWENGKMVKDSKPAIDS